MTAAVLLDANVLIALTVGDHVHHDLAEEWLTGTATAFATCPLTQGALIRLLLRRGGSVDEVRAVLGGLDEQPRHEFWPDQLPYLAVSLAGVVGHRQVTDAYLAALARARGSRLVTLDRGLALLHPDVAELVAVG